MKVKSPGYLVLVLVPLLWLSCGADPEPPLALIDDSPVTMSDLRHTPGYADYLDGFREKHDGRTPGLNEMKADPDFRDLLQQYVDDRSYLKVAAVKALQLQPTAVRAAMESSISQRFGSLKARQQWLSDTSHSAADFGKHVREAYLQWLFDHGLSEDDYRRSVEAGMRRDQVLRYFLTPTPVEVQRYCENGSADFKALFAKYFGIQEDKFSCKNPVVLRILEKQLLTMNMQNASLVKTQVDTILSYSRVTLFPGPGARKS